jgi:hypothetical protein
MSYCPTTPASPASGIALACRCSESSSSGSYSCTSRQVWSGEDEIHGGEGDDIDLDGDQKIDKIYGEEGNDLEVDGDHDNDRIFGGPGDDGGAPTSDNLKHHGLRGEGGENQVYGEDGSDTMDAQASVELGGAPEQIFGGDGDDTITAADGVEDEIDCGLGFDTVVSYDRGLDVLEDCETRIP